MIATGLRPKIHRSIRRGRRAEVGRAPSRARKSLRRRLRRHTSWSSSWGPASACSSTWRTAQSATGAGLADGMRF